MSEETHSAQVAAVEQKISLLSAKLSEAKAVVQQWTDANASLSRSAAEARAKNQGSGRGILGSLLGSKFRGAMRSAAASSNAAIAQDVAAKRTRITDGKREAQDLVRRIQDGLASAQLELKSLTSTTKSKAKTKAAVVKTASDSLDLLQKLKQARDAGLLTEEEYEQKRKKLLSNL